MSEKKNPKIKIELLIWLIGALFLLILFLIKSNDIFRNLKETAFFDRVRGKATEQTVQPYEVPGTSSSDTQIDLPVQTEPTEHYDEIYSEHDTTDLALVNDVDEDLLADDTVHETSAQQPAQIPVPEQPTIVPPSLKKTPVTLFFVEINADGSVTRKQITRDIPKTATPLTTSIMTLLKGPELDEKNKGCLSLIPAGTRLIAASVKDGIATLNFSEEFEFNTYGVEGYLGQLMQIVYTATTFSTVQSVQFLIEGQKKEYLGSEGVWIGTPLSRTSFK